MKSARAACSAVSIVVPIASSAWRNAVTEAGLDCFLMRIVLILPKMLTMSGDDSFLEASDTSGNRLLRRSRAPAWIWDRRLVQSSTLHQEGVNLPAQRLFP